ncbi:hypothetical protein DB347_03960 [Opitutaceae bacterium EW11]|nr:hypothetical protein DB347_03960 [Opitutaceae bacterium EW11]
MTDFESQSVRTLIALATRRTGIEPASCALAFASLGAAERLRLRLRRALASHRVSDLQFSILVSLFDAQPASIPMAVLARHAAVSRSAVTDAFDDLVGAGLAERFRDSEDRRIIRGRITAAGRERADQAIDDYLRAVTNASVTGRQRER